VNPIVAKFIADLQALQPGERLNALKEFGEQAQTLHFAALDEVREKMRSHRENPATEQRP
jgi:hypothetical protein